MTNHFQDVLTEVQSAPQGQRADKLIEGIAQQMSQSGEPELANELRSVKQSLTKAIQQQ